MNYVNLNGELISNDRPLFGAQNRAFRYGDGLFETIRVINGKPLFLEDHLRRLYDGMRMLKMEIPEILHIYHLENQIERLLQRSRITQGGKLRLAIFRNDGGLYTPTTNTISFLIEAESMENEFVLNPHGIDIGLYGDHLKAVNSISALKSSNSLLYVLAGEYAQSQKLGEVILLNEWKNLCEGVSTNLFLVINNKLVTPTLQQGCIPGIMRRRMLELAAALNIEVVESNISPEALMMANEVFFTNSIVGVKWAMAYGDKRYFASTSRKLCVALNEWTHDITK